MNVPKLMMTLFLLACAPPAEFDAYVKSEGERFRKIAVLIGARKE